MSGFLSGFRFPYVTGQNMTTYFHIRDQTRFMLLFRQRKGLEGTGRQLENSNFIHRVDNESNSSFSLFVWYVSFKCKIYKLVIVLNLLLSNRHTNKMDVKN